MAIQQKYNVIDLEKGTLDQRIFTDEQIYQDELQRIFKRAWLFVGHESIIPNPNDFFASYMGEDPIIVTRDSRGQVHVFLNMCRHRGNRVVRADDGSAKNFMCTYHGWTFSNEGKLVSVPGLQEGYHGELEVEKLGLVAARADTYAGLIFATWDQEAPTLEAYLGNMRWYLDIRFNHRDNGIQAYGPIKWLIPCNWKTPIDNAIGDQYHAKITHFSAHLVNWKFGVGRRRTNDVIPDQKTRYLEDKAYSWPDSHSVTPGNGHGVSFDILPDNVPGGLTATRNLTQTLDREAWYKYAELVAAEMDGRLGQFRARRIVERNFAVFPNWMLGLQAVHPRGPHHSEVWSWAFRDKDVPEPMKRGKLNSTSPTSIVNQDDIDNWVQVTNSSLGAAAQDYMKDLSMGLRHEVNNTQLNGMANDVAIAEINQRALYTRWQEFMNAESWKDIHIDPITATFEGTATMKG